MKKNIRKSVLSEIEAIAFSDFTRIVSLENDPEKGQIVSVADTGKMTRRDRRAVCSIKAGTKGVEVKLYDKLKALELLGRSCGVFGDKRADERDALEQLKSLFEESDEFDTDG